MSGRLTQSQIIETLLAQAEADRAERHSMIEAMRELTAAVLDTKRSSPAETFSITRAKVGEKVDAPELNIVRQEGESRARSVREGQLIDEALCSRFR